MGTWKEKEQGKTTTADSVISSFPADYADDIIKRLIFKNNYCIKQPVSSYFLIYCS